MNRIFQLCLISLFLCLQNEASTQTAIDRIIRCKNQQLYFSNGDSMKLVSLENDQYQLILFIFHAEEDTIGLDPGLSVNGRWRAIHLLKLFKEIPFKGFFTTPFRNNILTLQPLVDHKKANIAYYDQGDLQKLAENIQKLNPDPVIVVVHPETVAILFEKLCQKKFEISLDGNLSEKIIMIQKNKNLPSPWREFKYSIR